MILPDGPSVLLTRRASGLPAGGCWQLPGGHLDPGESVLDCVVRETAEEVGISVTPADVRFVHVRHAFTRTGDSRVVYLFVADGWTGTPRNAEPAHCDGIGFFPLEALPRPMVPHLADALGGYRRGEPFGISPAPPKHS
jgi:mutator protein MutT